jgi:hypothetical protein
MKQSFSLFLPKQELVKEKEKSQTLFAAVLFARLASDFFLLISCFTRSSSFLSLWNCSSS